MDPGAIIFEDTGFSAPLRFGFGLVLGHFGYHSGGVLQQVDER